MATKAPRYPLKEPLAENGEAPPAEAAEAQAILPTPALPEPETPMEPPWDSRFPDIRKPNITGGVPIQLDRKRIARLDFRALMEIEDKIHLVLWQGRPLSEITTSTRKMLAVVLASLRTDDPDLDEDKLMVLPGMELPNIPHITDVLFAALGLSMVPPALPGAAPEAPPATGEDPNEPAAG